MKGNVLHFSISEDRGLISADDGSRYDFVGREWKSNVAPRPGMRVDFELVNGVATAVYATPAAAGPFSDAPFYRSSDDRMLGGVCAGLAHKFRLSRAGVRVATVILTLCTGVLLLIYVALWVVLPEQPTQDTAVS